MTYKATTKCFDTICEHMDPPELLTQLAEEAAELGHAALKLRRTLTGKNPTPVTPQEAMDQLLEEIGDVFNVLDVLEHDDVLDIETVTEKSNEKLTRWVERLERAENG